jgi:hypothetical protein
MHVYGLAKLSSPSVFSGWLPRPAALPEQVQNSVLAQPTISAQLRALEESLGEKLLPVWGDAFNLPKTVKLFMDMRTRLFRWSGS